MFKVIILLATCWSVSQGAPASASFAKSVAISGGGSTEDQVGFESPITFKNGNIGVNFLGFKASAGLGGLLTGNAADGGLHAEAGTPFGQAAGAGLGGAIDGNGRSGGALYAGATAGSGVSAGAGLAGDAEGSASFAGASHGGFSSHVSKISPAKVAIHKEIVVQPAPVQEKHVEVEVKPQTTYVQKTVIPNYVEKKIQVPSYVEKTIRVPTTIEKTIRVPAPPTIIEKEIHAPSTAIKSSFEAEDLGTFKVIQKTKVHHHPHHHKVKYHQKVIGGGYGGGFGGGFFGGGGFGSGSYGQSDSGSYSATVTKSHNSQFFNDIFNIPIATLGAVNKLVGGLAGGTSGSVSVSKSFAASV